VPDPALPPYCWVGYAPTLGWAPRVARLAVAGEYGPTCPGGGMGGGGGAESLRADALRGRRLALRSLAYCCCSSRSVADSSSQGVRFLRCRVSGLKGHLT
jgi:hypothetical protein